jgi:putative addiction module component (TIGR02574 family)
MNDQATIAKLRALPVDERLRLMEEVWASLSDAPGELEIPDWHRTELDARLEAQRADPIASRPWPEVKAEILRSLGK